MTDKTEPNEASERPVRVEGDVSRNVEAALVAQGVFKGAHGLKGLLDAKEFWERQPYGTRLYYGDGIADYLHRDVLEAAVMALAANAPLTGAITNDKQSHDA